jgi:putative transposase
LDGTKLRLPKFRKGITIVLHREFTGKICSVTISRTASGKYYASFLIEQDLDIEQKTVEKDTALGLDVGLTDFVITSDGKKIERKRHNKNSAKKLKRLQRKLCKQQKGSNNRNKTKRKIAIVHEKVANRRNDYLHKVTRQLINENQVNTYCIEDLNVSGMLKNHKLARSISDVSWSEFARQLKYKADWAGKSVIQIGRFEASSKTCSHCGHVNKFLALNDRVWTCKCGVKHDRDINAAMNIRNFAFNNSEMIGQELSESKPVEKECSKALRRSGKREQLAVA